MTSCRRPVFFTASTTRWSSHVLMKVRLIGFCVGKTSWMPLRRYPPRSSVTVVRIVGTLNDFAAFASPTTLLTISSILLFSFFQYDTTGAPPRHTEWVVDAFSRATQSLCAICDEMSRL